MSSEYVMRTSLYLDRLKIFEWMKFLRRHLRQIRGKLSWLKFPNCLACEFPAYYACKKCRNESEIYKYQWIQLLNNKFH